MIDNRRPLLHAYRPGEAEVIIPAEYQDRRFELRSLRALVESVPDSLAFVHQDGEIIFEPTSDPRAAPWHNAVGALIERHFAEALARLLPAGAWRIDVLYPDAVEMAEHYSGDQVALLSLHPEQAPLM